MKKIICLTGCVLSLLLTLSCEENFSPKGELQDKCSINSISEKLRALEFTCHNFAILYSDSNIII